MSTHEMMEALSHFTMLALLVTLKLSISSCGTVQILMLGTIGITLPFMKQPLRARQMSALYCCSMVLNQPSGTQMEEQLWI
ncbi:hypothetical protein CIB84_013188 [Bambusicola thoracicus]|uniref:Uncharacterized protein n=1 Tax=Bambusicola thoracicus TaxID=9083 RepID=A0A2P4SG32_BAMTH|nr:hypothetical protein CIB84_013188 [Bambusicola thoracicus]